MALLPTPPGETPEARAICGIARDAMAHRIVMRARGRPQTDFIVVRESELEVLVQWAEYGIAMHNAQERE